MRSLTLMLLAGLFIAGSSGCRTCDDKPRLIDRLFHRDKDDCPSRSSRDNASLVKPCTELASRGCDLPGGGMVPGGYAQLHTAPVSGSMPLYTSGPFTAFPTPAAGSGLTAPGRDDELPQPRLPPAQVPTAPTSPANPNTLAAPGNGGRFTGDPRK